jgi:hypothetical protein
MAIFDKIRGEFAGYGLAIWVAILVALTLRASLARSGRDAVISVFAGLFCAVAFTRPIIVLAELPDWAGALIAGLLSFFGGRAVATFLAGEVNESTDGDRGSVAWARFGDIGRRIYGLVSRRPRISRAGVHANLADGGLPGAPEPGQRQGRQQPGRQNPAGIGWKPEPEQVTDVPDENFEAWRRVFDAFATPDEARALMREIGSVDDIRARQREHEAIAKWLTPERRAALDGISEAAESRAAIWRFVKTLLLWSAACAGFYATLKSIVPPGALPW